MTKLIDTTYTVIPRIFPRPDRGGNFLELHKVLSTVNLLLKKFFQADQKLSLDELENVFINLGYEVKTHESDFVHSNSLGLIKLKFVKLNNRHFTLLKFCLGGFLPQNIGEQKIAEMERYKTLIKELQNKVLVK